MAPRGPNSTPEMTERCHFILKSGEQCKFRHKDGTHCGKHMPKDAKMLVIKKIAKHFQEDPEDVDLEQMCDSPTSRNLVQGFMKGTGMTFDELIS